MPAAVPPASPASRARSSARREAILRAALNCFTAEGYASTSMDDVRTASGASIGSIYHHFKSKEQLALELHRSFLSAWWDLAIRILRPGRDPRRALRELVHGFLEWIERDPTLFHFLYFSPESPQLRGALRPQIIEEFERGQRPVSEWFREQAERKTLRRLPLDMYSHLIFGPVLDYAQRWARGVAETPIERAKAILADGVWRALRPEA